MSKVYFTVGITFVVALGAWAYSFYLTDSSAKQSALQKCIDGRLKLVPAYEKPAGIKVFADLCNEEFKLNLR
jgi:hypothetical protein